MSQALNPYAASDLSPRQREERAREIALAVEDQMAVSKDHACDALHAIETACGVCIPDDERGDLVTEARDMMIAVLLKHYAIKSRLPRDLDIRINLPAGFQ